MFYEVVLDWGPSKYFRSHEKARVELWKTYMREYADASEVEWNMAHKQLDEADKIDCVGAIYSFKFEDEE